VILTARTTRIVCTASALELEPSIAPFDATDFDRLERLFDELPTSIDRVLVTTPVPTTPRWRTSTSTRHAMMSTRISCCCTSRGTPRARFAREGPCSSWAPPRVHTARARSVKLAAPVDRVPRRAGVGRAGIVGGSGCLGLSDLIALKPKPGHLLGSLAQLGIPIIEGEVGGRGEISEPNITISSIEIGYVRFSTIAGHSIPEPARLRRNGRRSGAATTLLPTRREDRPRTCRSRNRWPAVSNGQSRSDRT
jgi:hypothetical protein